MKEDAKRPTSDEIKAAIAGGGVVFVGLPEQNDIFFMIRKKENGDLSIGIAGNQEKLSSQDFVDFLRENGGAGKIARDVLEKLKINTEALSTIGTELITDNTEEAKKTYFED